MKTPFHHSCNLAFDSRTHVTSCAQRHGVKPQQWAAEVISKEQVMGKEQIPQEVVQAHDNFLPASNKVAQRFPVFQDVSKKDRGRSGKDVRKRKKQASS